MNPSSVAFIRTRAQMGLNYYDTVARQLRRRKAEAIIRLTSVGLPGASGALAPL